MSKPLFKRLIRKFGMSNQLRQLQEECAELIVAVNHFERGRCSEAKVIEEAADVQIMIDQLVDYYGADAFDMAMKTKINRLNVKLLEEENG